MIKNALVFATVQELINVRSLTISRAMQVEWPTRCLTSIQWD